MMGCHKKPQFNVIKRKEKKMKINSVLSVFVFSVSSLLFVTSSAYSHGEDKAGPHGGEIRMPGAFHTEIVQKKSDTFLVYLLDINWKNPSIQNSKVKASVIVDSQSINLNCVVRQQYFECKSAKKLLPFKNGDEVTINAVRENVSAGPAVYELPLRKF